MFSDQGTFFNSDLPKKEIFRAYYQQTRHLALHTIRRRWLLGCFFLFISLSSRAVVYSKFPRVSRPSTTTSAASRLDFTYKQQPASPTRRGVRPVVTTKKPVLRLMMLFVYLLLMCLLAPLFGENEKKISLSITSLSLMCVVHSYTYTICCWRPDKHISSPDSILSSADWKLIYASKPFSDDDC